MTKIALILIICVCMVGCIPEEPCQLTAMEAVTVYNRPSAAAHVFSTLGTGESVEPAVKTADGFYGFDPGVAQAGNVGVFRNRWILKNYQVEPMGNCAKVPIVVGPISNLCYAMIMDDTPVFTSADTASAVLTTLHSGDYVQALGTASGWVKVDLNVGSISIDNIGWIQDSHVGYNGDCEG
jgi:hypothetical protein